MQNKFLISTLLTINSILMVFTAFWSYIFGVTGYIYFGVFAVPITVLCIFFALGQKFNLKTFCVVIFFSLLFTIVAYLPLIFSIYLIGVYTSNYPTLFTSLIGISLSCLTILFLLFYTIPKIINRNLGNDLHLESSFYVPSFLTVISVFSVDIFVKSTDTSFRQIQSIYGQLILLLLVFILFFVAPYFYVKSFSYSKISSPSSANKILFACSLVVLYIFLASFFSPYLRLPHCC